MNTITTSFYPHPRTAVGVAVRSLLLALLAFAALAVAAPAQTTPDNPYAHPQQLVDVGGRRLNLYCTGSGSPTVVLEGGLGASTAGWSEVQPAIAKQTRTCSYDRAGMGFSDGAPPPRDASAVVDDLHTLLRRAHVPAPYVLVAHSIAGLYAPLFADRYPDEVAGMVLVDPSFPHQYERFAKIAPQLVASVLHSPRLDGTCYAAAKAGTLDQADQSRTCGIPAPTDAFSRVKREQQLRPEYWLDMNAEFDALQGASSDENVREQRQYRAMPLVVLTGENTMRNPAMPEKSAEAVKIWRSEHERFAAYSTRGRTIVVAGAGHEIEHERPAAVISAVEDVVRAARDVARPRR